MRPAPIVLFVGNYSEAYDIMRDRLRNAGCVPRSVATIDDVFHRLLWLMDPKVILLDLDLDSSWAFLEHRARDPQTIEQPTSDDVYAKRATEKEFYARKAVLRLANVPVIVLANTDERAHTRRVVSLNASLCRRYVPAIFEAIRAYTGSTARTESSSLSKQKRILVVEDEPDIRDVFRDILELELEEYQINIAINGLDALQQLQYGYQHHLILLDIWMPVMTGFEFLQHRSRDRQLAAIPVIIVSGDLDLPERTAGFGVECYLAKPIDLDILLDTVECYTRTGVE